jgi:hypothetical protein
VRRKDWGNTNIKSTVRRIKQRYDDHRRSRLYRSGLVSLHWDNAVESLMAKIVEVIASLQRDIAAKASLEL